MNKLLKISLTGFLFLGANTTVIAEKSVEDAIEYRQAAMELIAWNIDKIGAIVNKKVEFNLEDFIQRTENLAILSRLPLEGFVPNSTDGETSAKADIFIKFDDFKEKMTKLISSSAELAKVAQDKKSIDGVKPQFFAVLKTCKSCHDKYKQK
jgi:cytochrome c556